MKTVLTIAGSDCSGGAGIQADIKTITAHGVYASSAITALTVQNTLGVYKIQEVSADFLAAQIDAICSDIYPDAVKIGMVFRRELVDVIAKKCQQYQWKHVVVDPVMISTSGHKLIQEDTIASLKEKLFPCASLLTPNLPEAQELCGYPVDTKETMEKAGIYLSKTYQTAVLMKAGHCLDNANDMLVEKERVVWYLEERLANPNTHGTGCTLSSAIASNLALGYTIEEAVQNAKRYITGAIKANLNLGQGDGPLNHMWNLKK